MPDYEYLSGSELSPRVQQFLNGLYRERKQKLIFLNYQLAIANIKEALCLSMNTETGMILSLCFLLR